MANFLKKKPAIPAMAGKRAAKFYPAINFGIIAPVVIFAQVQFITMGREFAPVAIGIFITSNAIKFINVNLNALFIKLLANRLEGKKNAVWSNKYYW